MFVRTRLRSKDSDELLVLMVFTVGKRKGSFIMFTLRENYRTAAMLSVQMLRCVQKTDSSDCRLHHLVFLFVYRSLVSLSFKVEAVG